MKEKYQSYENALEKLEIEKLDKRRERLCLNFALKCVKHEKVKKMFPLSDMKHQVEKRKNEK